MNYQYDKTNSLVRHDLSKALINEKTTYLIERGWIFSYPPQNMTSNQEKSMMRDPQADYRHGMHYEAAYALQKKRDEKNLFNLGVEHGNINLL